MARTGNAGGNGPSRTAATVTAIVALIVLVLFIVILWGKADDANNETAWARWTFLLAGIEAIAFAGAGFMFGREVNRGAAEQVEQAQKDAQENAAAAGAAQGTLQTIRNMATSNKNTPEIEDGVGLKRVIEVVDAQLTGQPIDLAR